MTMTIMTVLYIKQQMNQPQLSGDIFSWGLVPKSSFGTPYKHVSIFQQKMSPKTEQSMEKQACVRLNDYVDRNI